MEHDLHNWVVAWCSDRLPGWLAWEVAQLGQTVTFYLGSGALRQNILITPDDQDGLSQRLTVHVQMYLMDLRDKCELASVRLGYATAAEVPLSLRPTDPLPLLDRDDHDT